MSRISNIFVKIYIHSVTMILLGFEKWEPVPGQQNRNESQFWQFSVGFPVYKQASINIWSHPYNLFTSWYFHIYFKTTSWVTDNLSYPNTRWQYHTRTPPQSFHITQFYKHFAWYAVPKSYWSLYNISLFLKRTIWFTE